MLINEISIQNYKSFGNNKQTLKLPTDKGQLILLTGSNGDGKSSILEAFEYTLYNKVMSNKSKKWHSISTLPNRINGELLTEVKFNSNNTDIELKRGHSPNILELKENSLLNEKAGKSSLNKKIEDYVGMDIETFKSFISMSINDFKNFISLSNQEKKLLLDKLFNLEVINILNDILKDFNKENKNKLIALDSEINALNDSIASIQDSINKSIEKEKENTQQTIDEYKTFVNSKRGEYLELKRKVEEIEEIEEKINKELEEQKEQYLNLKNSLKNVEGEIDLYNQGKCPTCGTSFKDQLFEELKSSLYEKKSKYENLMTEIKKSAEETKERKNKLKTTSKNVTNSFNDLVYLLKNYKNEIKKLEKKKDLNNTEESDNVQEFKNTIEDLKKRKERNEKNKNTHNEKELYYKELSRILSEDGVKKSIISSIIKPINSFLKENITKMGLPFNVELDDKFSAKIKSLGTQIDPNTLSTGEAKKINIAILIAYLKLIRTKKNINILFLDEVFSSLDLTSIGSILELLKAFANEYNINIFVIHHAILNEEMFDRIIRINKDIFSTIEEVK